MSLALRELGYEYVGDKLLDLEGNAFSYTTEEDYDELGEAITNYIQEYLTENLDLERIFIPSAEPPNSFIFLSKGLSSSSKLIVLIHGGGRVRAGLWSRALCINEGLSLGSMIPFFRADYSYLILNTNESSPSLVDPISHAVWVWENIVKSLPVQEIFIVAHSFGGAVVMQLLSKLYPDFALRVKKIALVDSVHGEVPDNSDVKSYLFCKCINWVVSNQSIETFESNLGLISISAGTTDHSKAPNQAVDSIFRFFESNSLIEQFSSYDSKAIYLLDKEFGIILLNGHFVYKETGATIAIDSVEEQIKDVLYDYYMERTTKLGRLTCIGIPLDLTEFDSPYSNVYISNDWYSYAKAKLLIISDSRAGMWTEVNPSMDTSIFYTLQLAEEHKFHVAVLNPYLNHCKGQLIPRSSTPEEHVDLFFKEFLLSDCSLVFIIANRQAGKLVSYIYENYGSFVESRIGAVALMDAQNFSVGKFSDKTVEWVRNEEEMNSVVSDLPHKQVSAGTQDETLCLFLCQQSIFMYFESYFQVTNI